tara:strand:+ start:124 stop:975 length:852 start_codon:yes stop_codon:yes gene_type:complete
MHDDLLIGTEHSRKIIPDCTTPSRGFTFEEQELTQTEKADIIITDPKFGMFSLFKYHLNRGYRNEKLKQKNAFYCSHVFSLLTGLPVMIFMAQWSIYIAIVANEVDNYDGRLCPNESDWKKKLIMFGVSTLYFVRSFFLWDNLTDRTRLQKLTPSVDVLVMIDTFQEFGFNLFVNLANLWIIFKEDNLYDMVLNCVAMEFLMNLDNEFEEMYFKYLPESADDIYDNVFVSYNINQEHVKEKKKSRCFKCITVSAYIPFKLLTISLMVFPLLCFFMIIYTPLCK